MTTEASTTAVPRMTARDRKQNIEALYVLALLMIVGGALLYRYNPAAIDVIDVVRGWVASFSNFQEFFEG